MKLKNLKKLKIYIASPYTLGNKIKNVRLQIDAFHILRDMGFIPIPPLTSHYINEVQERTHAEWLEYDFEILRTCDMIVRIRPLDEYGKEIYSSGADMEEKEAKRLGLPYYEFKTLEEMKIFFENYE